MYKLWCMIITILKKLYNFFSTIQKYIVYMKHILEQYKLVTWLILIIRSKANNIIMSIKSSNVYIGLCKYNNN